LKPLGKKSLTIDEEIHRKVAQYALDHNMDMYEAIREAWECFERNQQSRVARRAESNVDSQSADDEALAAWYQNPKRTTHERDIGELVLGWARKRAGK